MEELLTLKIGGKKLRDLANKEFRVVYRVLLY
jgi:hypothetical protein